MGCFSSTDSVSPSAQALLHNEATLVNGDRAKYSDMLVGKKALIVVNTASLDGKSKKAYLKLVDLHFMYGQLGL